jgi:ribosome-associated protein
MPGIKVTSVVTIPESEVSFRFSRSGGPGGQHANTSDTKVELRFDVAGSVALTAAQRGRAMDRLSSRLTDAGELVLTSNEHRSQTRNREAVLARFAAILAEALRVPRERRASGPTRAARRRRLEAKRRQSGKKALRRPPKPEP